MEIELIITFSLSRALPTTPLGIYRSIYLKENSIDIMPL